MGPVGLLMAVRIAASRLGSGNSTATACAMLGYAITAQAASNRLEVSRLHVGRGIRIFSSQLLRLQKRPQFPLNPLRTHVKGSHVSVLFSIWFCKEILVQNDMKLHLLKDVDRKSRKPDRVYPAEDFSFPNLRIWCKLPVVTLCRIRI